MQSSLKEHGKDLLRQVTLSSVVYALCIPVALAGGTLKASTLVLLGYVSILGAGTTVSVLAQHFLEKIIPPQQGVAPPGDKREISP